MKPITLQTVVKNFSELLIIILFITGMTRLFGQQEALTSVASITALLMFAYFPLDMKVSDGLFLTSASFFIVGSLASLNLILAPLPMLLINLISILGIVWLFGKQFEYKLYIPFILLYIFAATTDPVNFSLTKRLLALCLASALIAIIYWLKHRKICKTNRLLEKATLFPLSSAVRRSALTMSLGISFTLFFSSLLPVAKPMWICMTIMSLTQINPIIFKERFKNRLAGSLVGMIIYFGLFSLLVPAQFHLPLTLVLAYFYTFITNYFWQIVFITLNVFYASSLVWQLEFTVITRLSFIVLGSLIVFSLDTILNRYFIPSESS